MQLTNIPKSVEFTDCPRSPIHNQTDFAAASWQGREVMAI